MFSPERLLGEPGKQGFLTGQPVPLLSLQLAAQGSHL